MSTNDDGDLRKMTFLAQVGFFLGHIMLFGIFLFGAIVLHELGHYYKARKYGTAKISYKNWTFTTEFPDILTISQKKAVFWSGIAAGMIIILLYMPINPIMGFCMFLLYLGGCVSDFKAIRELNKQLA